MKTYTCPHCNTNSLKFSADAKWDNHKQEFVYELESFYFDANQAFCVVCDIWVDFEASED
jgi:hypothetical protein